MALTIAFAAPAATQLEQGDAVTLSGHGGAFKTKITSLTTGPNAGRLVVVYGDTPAAARTVYDVKAQSERPARDVFIRYCDAQSVDCSDLGNWSAAEDISNTVAQSSSDADWRGNGAEPYPGDSGKPQLFAAGNRVVVTWTDTYCPDGDPATVAADPVVQRSVTYFDLDDREIPFSCLYVASSADGGATWKAPVQLSSGERDAIQDVSRGLGSGQWAITWQEDPLGLQLGSAEGPGEGASGARVSGGTEIWYAYANGTWTDDDAADGYGFWHPPVRLTDNATQTAAGPHDVVKDSSGAVVDDASIEGGDAGASRANLALQYNPDIDSAPTALVAYEESKDSEGVDAGKFVRYHHFAWNDPASSPPQGCIISNPADNARRVRFVPQKNPGTQSGMRLAIFWKEGEYTQGGPSDIMLRKGIASGGSTGFAPSDMTPPVDTAGCDTSDYTTAIALNNTRALNISSRTQTARAAADTEIASSTLADSTSQNFEENAIAHRALLRGDDLYVGYTYTPVLSELLYNNTQNYNFYIRHYDGAVGQWSAPENLSNITDTSINVREPRLVGTPSSGPGCADPSSPADPEQCQDTSVFYVAWGLQTNVSAWSLEQPENLDLQVGRGEDRGAYYTDLLGLAATDHEEAESQLRPTPAGHYLYAVWNETDATGSTRAKFRIVSTYEAPEDTDAGLTGAAGDGDSKNWFQKAFGCTYSPEAPFDPLLPALVAGGFGLLTYRNRRRRK